MGARSTCRRSTSKRAATTSCAHPPPPTHGSNWQTKNHYEHKTGERVLLEANVFENVWGGFTQPGKAIVVTPKYQSNVGDPGEPPPVKHYTARWLWVKKAGGLFQMALDKTQPGLEENHYSFHDIIAEELSYPECYSCGKGGNAYMEISGGNTTFPSANLHDVEINHISVIEHPQANRSDCSLFYTGSQVLHNITLTNSIGFTGRYGAHAEAFGPGMCVPHQPATYTDLIDACWKPGVFKANVLVGDPKAAGNPKKWPAGNQFVANVGGVGFKGDGTYALADDSPFKGAGTDGRDPGPDIPRLLAAIDGVEAGVSTSA